MKAYNNAFEYLNKIKKHIWPLFRAALLIGLGYIILYPILYMISMSFRDVQDLYNQTVRWVPLHFTFDNFTRIIKGIDYFSILKNTAVVSIGSSLLLLPVCSLVAYSLARFEYKGKGIVMGAVLFTIVVPVEFFTSSQFLNLSDFSLFGIFDIVNAVAGTSYSINVVDSYWSFFLPAIFGIGVRSGLYIFILRQTFRGLPKELEEAAAIDGCGFIKTFLSIIVPSAIPAFVTVTLFSFVWHWNDYQLSSMFMPTHGTLAAALKNLSSLLYGAAELGVAVDAKQNILDSQVASLLLIIPVLIVYVFAQRFFTDSIERTGLVE